MKQAEFYDIVKEKWEENINKNIFWRVHQKMKKTSKAHNDWSKAKIGDIFVKANQMEDMVNFYEEQYMHSGNSEDRMSLNKAKAEAVTHHKMVDAFRR